MHGAPFSHRVARGFTLVEALIGLALLAFALLAIGSLQSQLSLHAELARQRSEATRLARQQLELLRHRDATHADLVAGEDAPPPLGNTAYLRRWRLAGEAGDTARLAEVNVAWADRRGTPQRIALTSVLATTDPSALGALVLGAARPAEPRYADGRHAALPLPAERLANSGRSVLPWHGASGGFLLFDDASGSVVAHCQRRPTHAAEAWSPEVCAPRVASLLSGYIGGALPADPGLPTLLFDQIEHLAGPPECVTAPAHLWHDAGIALPGMRHYRCLMQPMDHDGDPRTAPVWSARVRLGGLAPDTPVCRYGGPGTGGNDAPTGPRHVEVAGSLDNQNYFIGPCPDGSLPHPTL